MAVLTKVHHDLCPNESAAPDDHDFHSCPFVRPPKPPWCRRDGVPYRDLGPEHSAPPDRVKTYPARGILAATSTPCMRRAVPRAACSSLDRARNPHFLGNGRPSSVPWRASTRQLGRSP